MSLTTTSRIKRREKSRNDPSTNPKIWDPENDNEKIGSRRKNPVIETLCHLVKAQDISTDALFHCDEIGV